jgi:glycerate dehydrogenase
MATVLISFEADAEDRRVIEEVLAGSAEIVYLTDTSGDERDGTIGRADIVLAGSLRSELSDAELQAANSLKFLQILPAGANRIPFDSIREDVVLASNVGAYAEPMAEHVLAMVLALAKNIVSMNDELRQGIWERSDESRLLRGTTACIVGFGGIGQATAKLLRCFGVEIVAVNRTGSTRESVQRAVSLDKLDEVLPISDIVVLSLPLTKQTRGLIGAGELACMKGNAILINVARGPLIDENALYDHAENNPSFLIGLDVWWDEPFTDGRFRTETPILELPNVIGSPHNSGHVPGMGLEGVRRASRNIAAFLSGESPAGVVDRTEY